MITLLTDFGTADHFVGVMKGVIAAIAPGVPVVDLSHEVPAYDVMTGAFLLEQSWRYFPKGTVHVAVVDPGVGSARRGILVEAEGHLFVGPDNGIFSFVLGDRARVLDKPAFWLPTVSATFHGRDVFAPVAAYLSTGVKPARMGGWILDAHRLTGLVPTSFSPGAWTGVVLHVDRFGNVITNFSVAQFPDLSERRFEMVGGARRSETWARTYASCPDGVLCLIPGSSGYYEISMKEGSAAVRTGLAAGAVVELKLI